MNAQARFDLPGESAPGGIGLHPVLRALLYIALWWIATALLAELAAQLVEPLDRYHVTLDQNANLFVAVACECAAAVGVALLFRRFIDRRPAGTLA